MCRVGRFLVVFLTLTLILLQDATLAGARIDLRPAPPPNGAEYQVGDVFNVEVFMVDTGNPQGDILFRGLVLDFSDSTGVSFPGENATFGTVDDNQFDWTEPLPGWPVIHPDLPVTAWIWSLPNPVPIAMLTLPNEGELLLGDIHIRLDSPQGILDVMNADDPDLDQHGAQFHFGYGGPGDPVTRWYAQTGDVTGGVLIAPEPASLALVILATAGTFMRIRSRL